MNTSAREKVTFRVETRRDGKKKDKIIDFSRSLICLFFFRIFILTLLGRTSCSRHQCKSHKHLTSNLIPHYNKQFPSHCIAFIGHSKHELTTCQVLPEKNGVILHPYLPITATFFCPQGGRCGEVQLYFKEFFIMLRFEIFAVVWLLLTQVTTRFIFPKSVLTTWHSHIFHGVVVILPFDSG